MSTAEQATDPTQDLYDDALGQPVELARIYVQLASAEGSYATNQVYGSAGGNGLP